jgi:hypothetical protein
MERSSSPLGGRWASASLEMDTADNSRQADASGDPRTGRRAMVAAMTLPVRRTTDQIAVKTNPPKSNP